MAKETFAEKIAKKGFYSALVQRSWQTHIQAFGPILEPAFVDKYQARVHLTAALNHISSHELKKGLEKLKKVEKFISIAENTRDFSHEYSRLHMLQKNIT